MPSPTVPEKIVTLRPLLIAGLVVMLLAAIGGVAFGGWLAHGPQMLNSLWAAGLAWCM